MDAFKYIKKIDFTLLFVVLTLFTIGLVAIRTATNIDNFVAGDSSDYMIKQMLAFAIGTVGMIILMSIDYQMLGQYWIHIYVLCLLLLMTVWIPGLGVANKNALRWINLGFVELQPSEIVKIGFIVVFAKLLDKRKEKLNKITDILILIAFIVPFLILIAAQPDLGQSLIFIVISAGMIFTAGLSMKYIYGAIVGVAVGVPLLWNFYMLDYQKHRIITYLNPTLDPLGEGYHTIQSITTIGSGGVLGKGFSAENTMTNLNYLPAQWTDFIFSVIAETTGFVGASIVVIILGLFLFRLIKDAREAKDEYGTLIIVGVFFMFLFQIFENIGMTMGIMPITGITLPFLSYGGSSLMTNLMAVGLVLNVYIRRHYISFE
ncbi:rod shape-determining protein RodA [Alkalibaculum sp. M08DMB]|uniref:Rod shape-determining protein RodA n=1 Tax=Alkalibaculum sporogenes TaxID=2655001 RepID=A0A6A7KB23_9FIRM|nr:rod shape-determining protein RodA [Alkalibaculum sporogenes]MPW26596.1 rod shape-determining protein RodA [Alkalibaculum sporogenes]